jgi:Holliday junction resolvase-like predicted endonuclease
MSVEREILIAMLKLTRNGPTEYSVVSKSARAPTQIAHAIIQKLVDQALIRWTENTIEATRDQRVKIAVHAIELGADFERVCKTLEWSEFESIATEIFKANDYHVLKNLRFKEKNGKRWEIDLLACRRPLILSVDCKHWQHKWTRGPIITTVEQQVMRTRAISDALPRMHNKIGLDGWTHATVVPMILSLIPAQLKLHQNTPVVAVLQLQSFLNELPAYTCSLTRFTQKFPTRKEQITEYL